MAANIVIDYLQLSSKHMSEYGPNTVVLYMVGSFYEIYSLQNPLTQQIQNITPIVSVCDICNLNIANKQSCLGNEKIENTTSTSIAPFPAHPANEKQIRSWLNEIPSFSVVMAGFRDYSLDKYLDKLVSHGFTIVVYDQEKLMQGKKEIVQRKLSHVFSPGTYMTSSLSNTILTNNVMCIWIETVVDRRSLGKQSVICGVANCNILTADTHMFEHQSVIDTRQNTFCSMIALDELERIICSFRPKECIFIFPKFEGLVEQSQWTKYLGIDSHTKLHWIDLSRSVEQNASSVQKVQNCSKQSYIQHILNLFYQTKTTDIYQSCKEFQEYTIATQAFCYLLDFIQEHNANLVKRLNFPVFNHASNRLLLANQTLQQLNIVPSKHHESGHLSSVETFLNKCSTAMGKRMFRYQLLNPVFDPQILDSQYESIQVVLDSIDQETLRHLRKSLSQIKDIEKMCRQIVLRRMPPTNILQLYQSLETYLNACYSFKELFRKMKGMDEPSSTQEIGDFLAFLNSKFFLEKICNEEKEAFIKPGVSLSLDILLTQQNANLASIQSIQKYFSDLIQEKVKLHETEKNGISIQFTKKRAASLKQTLASLSDTHIQIDKELKIERSSIKLHHSSANYEELDFPELSKIAKEQQKLKEDLKEKYNEVYQEILADLEGSWYNGLYRIAQEIARLDVLLNKAFLARENKYCRPQLDTRTERSFLRCQQLRHCLIEHIQTNEIYVPNDVVFDQDQEGIILTGYNGIGKSSLIRSIGICIILAQSGMFVPCESMVYSPYKALYCCIEKRDNLFRNMSTFQLEMSEIRVILNHADKTSMVLGDELMNSTELQSGISIMISVLEHLCNHHVSFIIATHYNQLDDYDEITELCNLQMKHMEVVYDHTKGDLVYDRRLKEGLGNKCYGLEVARSLCISENFMDRAFQIRNQYFTVQRGVLSMNPSKYNSKKLKGLCEVCKLKMGTEVHHVLEQHKADKEGFIGHVYKNHVANLKSLCEQCHKQIHHGL